MFVADGYYTEKTATEVGSMLKHLFENPEDTSYYQLVIVRHDPDQEAERQTLHIRLIESLTDRVIVLANGREIVRCTTRDGKRLDLIFGEPSEREIEPAMALIEP